MGLGYRVYGKVTVRGNVRVRVRVRVNVKVKVVFDVLDFCLRV